MLNLLFYISNVIYDIKDTYIQLFWLKTKKRMKKPEVNQKH